MKRNLLGASLFTFTCLYGILFAIVFLVCLFLDVELSVVILSSIIVLLIQFLLAPFFTDLSMKWFYKANFKQQIPEYLTNFINDICSQHKMKYPKIGIITDGGPNAFTYGHTKNDARIILTSGMFDILTPDEIKGVVAHEIGHAVHYDMALMTMAELVPLILYYIYEIFIESIDGDEESSKLAVIGIVAYVFYIISQYIILWLSRTREYYADSFSVTVTKNPSALAEALVKVGYGLTTNNYNRESSKSVSNKNALGIFDSDCSKSLAVSCYGTGGMSKTNIMHAMKWEMWNVWAKWYELHSTHPMISKRLKAISERCSEFNQMPYIDFNFQQPESYVDDFLGELFILLLPVIVIIGGLAIMAFMYAVKGEVDVLKYICGIVAGVMLSYLIKLQFTHKNRQYKTCSVFDLLSEVKVSGVTSVPCILEGEIIGRGDPGCIFSEDLVLKDQTGMIFLDYKRVFRIMDKFVALFKTKAFFNKRVKVTGWYRRSPVPYVEIYKILIDGEEKERVMKSFTVSKIFAWIIFVICVILIFVI